MSLEGRPTDEQIIDLMIEMMAELDEIEGSIRRLRERLELASCAVQRRVKD